LNLAIGAVVNAGDLAGNAFNLPLYIPAIDVQYLSGTGNNNLQFQDILIQPGTLTSGQSVALNAIGTQNTTNLSYVFPGNFTISQGATLAVGPNVPVTLGPPANGVTQTLADNGTLTFEHGSNDWHDITTEDEAFFMRVYGPGEYRFHGADLGILVTKGRMQTAEGLTDRCRHYIEGIRAQYQSEPLPQPPAVKPVAYVK
ncbi:MAG TPA: hypothetical protein VKG61_12105, partial [Streptosporangiaceae bacterium]|nr:hypothetical protein [Streptosporangiaceae bacterium]